MPDLRERQKVYTQEEVLPLLDRYKEQSLMLDCNGQNQIKASVYEERKIPTEPEKIDGVREALKEGSLPRGQFMIRNEELFRIKKIWISA